MGYLPEKVGEIILAGGQQLDVGSILLILIVR